MSNKTLNEFLEEYPWMTKLSTEVALIAYDSYLFSNRVSFERTLRDLEYLYNINN